MVGAGSWEAEDPFGRRESKYPGGEAGMAKWPIGKETGKAAQPGEDESLAEGGGLWEERGGQLEN